MLQAPGADEQAAPETVMLQHRRLLPLLDALFCLTNPIPVKYALNQIGFECGPFRFRDPSTGKWVRARCDI
jgi:dihydrodipicolinate synthase/N-acetylneuraminate lyase